MKWFKDLIMESESFLPLLIVAVVVVVMCCVGGMLAASIWGSDAFWCGMNGKPCP